MSPDLRDLQRAYNDAVRLKAIYPKFSVGWGRAQNDLTRALAEARKLTGDEMYHFPVK